MAALALRALAAASLVAPVLAIENGLGLRPPMGWRSWNLFGANVDQSLMVSIMDGMVARKRLVDGKPTSLCDLGYCDIGLDDNWQACGKGTNLYRYHAKEGNEFYPVVNTDRFPDLAKMTQYAHDLGLTAGWYGNNCLCKEMWPASKAVYRGDVKALIKYGFDGIKLDGCGTQLDLNLWSKLINETGKPILIENCHWGFTVPTKTHCPWNVYRTSGDVRASYGSVVGNLLAAVSWGEKGLSRPGCWAYPDMLQVGVAHGAGGEKDPGLSPAETRSHFGAWCIISSPLVLAYDVNNDIVSDAVWPIVSNVDAIAVNQAWAGHSGGIFKQSSVQVALDDFFHVLWGRFVAHTGKVHSWQYFYKRLPAGKVAVLLMNHHTEPQDLVLHFSDVPGLVCSMCHMRDVWQRSDVGMVNASISLRVEPHDSAFLILSPSAADVDVVV